MRRKLVTIWGITGVLALLGQAIWRMCPWVAEAFESDLGGGHWAFAGIWVLFMAHAEGYRGFHRRVSPRVVARARHLARHPRPVSVALAPFYCMSLFGASRRGVIVARSVFVGVVVLIMIVRTFPQPWRGLVDAGVVVGLGIGVVSILYHALGATWGRRLPVGPDLPAGRMA